MCIWLFAFAALIPLTSLFKNAFPFFCPSPINRNYKGDDGKWDTCYQQYVSLLKAAWQPLISRPRWKGKNVLWQKEYLSQMEVKWAKRASTTLTLNEKRFLTVSQAIKWGHNRSIDLSSNYHECITLCGVAAISSTPSILYRYSIIGPFAPFFCSPALQIEIYESY